MTDQMDRTIRIARGVISACVPGSVDKQIESVVHPKTGVLFYTVSTDPETGDDYAVSMSGVAPGRIVKVRETRFKTAADGSRRVRIVNLDDNDQGGFVEVSSMPGRVEGK